MNHASTSRRSPSFRREPSLDTDTSIGFALIVERPRAALAPPPLPVEYTSRYASSAPPPPTRALPRAGLPPIASIHTHPTTAIEVPCLQPRTRTNLPAQLALPLDRATLLPPRLDSIEVDVSELEAAPTMLLPPVDLAPSEARSQASERYVMIAPRSAKRGPSIRKSEPAPPRSTIPARPIARVAPRHPAISMRAVTLPCPATPPSSCSACDGSGSVPRSGRGGTYWTDCPSCGAATVSVPEARARIEARIASRRGVA